MLIWSDVFHIKLCNYWKILALHSVSQLSVTLILFTYVLDTFDILL